MAGITTSCTFLKKTASSPRSLSGSTSIRLPKLLRRLRLPPLRPLRWRASRFYTRHLRPGHSGQSQRSRLQTPPLGSIEGGIFHVSLQRPLSKLTQQALAAQPPHESGAFLNPDLIDLATLDPTIHFDIRYATKSNFLSAPVYSQPKAYMQRPAAEALLRASHKLNAPVMACSSTTPTVPGTSPKSFGTPLPQDKRIFVANPADGSRHNRGCAVDLTLYDLKTGKPIEITGVYDRKCPSAPYPFYPRHLPPTLAP